ncbi:MAG: ATP-binding protein [Nanoarchaeota archaeon]|nr:ATP-binding protein [Nanoarchaeota archaeon]
MEELEIVRVLNRYNPWWDGKPIPESKTNSFKRGDFFVIRENLKRKEICSIVGPRRVGKTILIHQLIQDLLDSGVDPKRILYLSIDEVELNRGGAELKHILKTYANYIIKRSLDCLEETHYLFLDEIQELPHWEKILKNWHDLGHNLKFIISGSSSIWITKGTEESLLGRIKTSIMMPLKFSEILRYKKVLGENFAVERKRVQTAFIKSIDDNDLSAFKNELEHFVGGLAPKRDEIEIELNRYMVVGGYPEFLEEKDYTRIGESVRDKIKLIFFKDIVRYFKIRNPKVLEDLFKILAKNSSNHLNIMDTARLLDIQRPTLKDYLRYLAKAYLIKASEFYSISRKARIRKQNKWYVLDPGIRNGISDYLDDSLLKNETELGIVVESILFDHLSRLKYNLEPGPETEIFYWKNKKEIDFVLTIKRKPVPIESKYRMYLPQENLNEIDEFIKKNDSPLGIVVTKDLFKLDGLILKIPLWIFLLIV